jgi:hypothetical protein
LFVKSSNPIISTICLKVDEKSSLIDELHGSLVCHSPVRPESKRDCASAVKRVANCDIYDVLLAIISSLAGVWKIDVQWRRALTGASSETEESRAVAE